MKGIANKLERLSGSVNELGNQITKLDFVTPQDFSEYQEQQTTTIRDIEERISKLEDREQEK